MNLSGLTRFLPDWKNALLAVVAAVLLILAFPDFEIWALAWFALVPLLWAVERQKHCVAACFTLGWIFGTIFFFGTCWWLTYAPITYAGFPPLLAYFLLFCVTSVAAIFPGIFAAILSVLLRRLGSIAILAAPFVWVFTEFLRYWLTGNNWNAIGYSQAFGIGLAQFAELGGVLFVSFTCLVLNAVLAFALLAKTRKAFAIACGTFFLLFAFRVTIEISPHAEVLSGQSGGGGRLPTAKIIAVQPNVPMSGLDAAKWRDLRDKQVGKAEAEIRRIRNSDEVDPPMLVILPESPMNFMYHEDLEFQQVIGDFVWRNYVSVLFNSAEPNKTDGKYFNSAVLVSPEGKVVAQYDKIYLLPFGESVPAPLQSIVPAFVGSFSYGSEYDLLPLGDAKAGVMICFESHFGELSREYVRRGADVIIEMTNDGYLGPTPVLRQHLANAVFRAVETNRPVLRVTNVGITAYINERGEVLDPTESYTEDTRVWSVSKSDGEQTFYVRYGDWFAWLCTAVTLVLLVFGLVRKNRVEVAS
jgi:apolipoprotein N-acyltransferase